MWLSAEIKKNLVHKELSDDKIIVFFIEQPCGFTNILVGDNTGLSKKDKPLLWQNSELTVLSVSNNLKNYYVPVLLPTYTPSLSRLLMHLLNSH